MLRGSLALAALCGAQDLDVYTTSRTTEKGCKCKDPCKTDFASGTCDVAEFCVVEDPNCPGGTADFSVLNLGFVDWCTYEPFQSYESLDANSKKSILLSKARDGAMGKYPATLNVLTGILGESVRLTFDSNSDVFPAKRTKYIHSVGVTGGISLTSVGGHPYQGLFTGAEHGMVRFSSAKEPGKGGFAPGMGVKFLRDGRRSASFVSMYSLDGEVAEVKNFFEHDWSNHIPMTDNFGLKIIAAKFWQASNCPLQVGISDLASSADGVPAPRGSFPYQLIWKPAISSHCDSMDYKNCLDNLEAIPVGTKIFDLQAVSAPHATPKTIGYVTLTDALQRSKFGDEQFFIQHQYMEEDFAIHPEWLDAIDKKNECGMKGASTRRPATSTGCTSPFGKVMLDDDEIVA